MISATASATDSPSQMTSERSLPRDGSPRIGDQSRLVALCPGLSPDKEIEACVVATRAIALTRNVIGPNRSLICRPFFAAGARCQCVTALSFPPTR